MVIDEDYTQNDCLESSVKGRPLLRISPLRLPMLLAVLGIEELIPLIVFPNVVSR